MTTAIEKTKAIHAAVDEASDVMLQDAPYDENQASMLRDMGFTSAENLVDFEDHGRNKDFARMYAKKYPLYKFITAHQLEKIKTKYTLIQGPLSAFKGKIPKKNIKEMMNFRIERGDISRPVSTTGGLMAQVFEEQIMRAFGVTPNGGDAMGLGGMMKTVRALSATPPSISVMGRSTGKTMAATMARLADWQIPVADDLYGKIVMPELGKKSGSDHFSDAIESVIRLSNKVKTEDEIKKEKLSFSAIAKGYYPKACTITAEKGLFDLHHPDWDPIVTVAVNGGYLIVTAWGPEASEPDVVNQVMN